MYARRISTSAALLLTALLAACSADAELPTSTDGPAGVDRVETAEGRDLAAAVRIHDRLTPSLMDAEGVIGTGLAVGDGEPRIIVYMEGERGRRPRLPARLDGLPVETIETGRFVAGSAAVAVDPNNPTTRERPVPNGFSVGHPDITAGTLGAIVRDAAGVCYALSNNHVLANVDEAQVGDPALQPGPFDGGVDPTDAIGTLAAFKRFVTKGRKTNLIDAAIAELADASDVTGATPSGAYGAPGTSPVAATLGMAVQKFGRTTGHTSGSVSEINVTVDVCYEPRFPFGCNLTIRFSDQIGVTPGAFSDGGDSGSLIVTGDGARSPVGLLFAGSTSRTLANPITAVLDEFGVAIETNPASCVNGGSGPGNTPPDADFSFSTDGLTVDFTDASDDSDGSVVGWDWDFDDGNGSSSQNPSHTFATSGSFDVTLTVTDNDGATDALTQTVTVDDGTPGGGIALEAAGRKQRGRHVIDLSWTGAAGASVDVYRNGGLIATTANDGAYSDATGNRGGATYTHRVCEAGTTTCSNTTTTSY